METSSDRHFYPPIKEDLKMRVRSLMDIDSPNANQDLFPGVVPTNDLFSKVVTEGEVFLCQVNKRERLLFETVYLEEDVIDSLGLENPYQDILWLVPLNPDVVLDPIPLVVFAKAIIGSVKMTNFDSEEYTEHMLQVTGYTY